MTYSGFIKGNIGEAGVIYADLLWGFCILCLRNQCFGASWPFCRSQAMKCIDSCRACFVPTLKVKGNKSLPLTTESNIWDNITLPIDVISYTRHLLIYKYIPFFILREKTWKIQENSLFWGIFCKSEVYNSHNHSLSEPHYMGIEAVNASERR